jgi:hypothetical protein
MTFAQRGSSPVSNQAASSTLKYNTLDRWGYWANALGYFYLGQSTASVPTGYTNSALITSGSATTVSSGVYATFSQRIEGYNVADLAWGTSSAQSVSVSFWVNCSLTGTFSGYVSNSGNTYSYPFTFTISAANTWQQITQTIPGPTTGSWNNTTGIGIEFGITLAAGSTYQDTANAWTTKSFAIGSAGSTNLLATNGATMYISGVQLEAGSAATTFDYRSFATEAMLCRRYYQQYSANSNTGQTYFLSGNVYNSTLIQCIWQGQGDPFRTDPTLTYAGTFTLLNGASTYTVTPSAIFNTNNSDPCGVTSFQIQMTGTGLPTGSYAVILINSSGAYLGLSAEL